MKKAKKKSQVIGNSVGIFEGYVCPECENREFEKTTFSKFEGVHQCKRCRTHFIIEEDK